MNTYIQMLESRKMTLIMSLPDNNADFAKAALDAGADVLKIHINLNHHASSNHFGTLDEERERIEKIIEVKGDVPLGIVPGQDVRAVEPVLPQLEEMGFDFVSLYAHHAPLALKTMSLKRMIAFDYSYDLNDLKYLDADVFEASIMDPDTYGNRLSEADVMRYRKARANTKLPIVVPTQRFILPQEVSVLKEAGINGIMLGAVVTGQTANGIYETVKAFRSAIGEL